MLKNLLLFLFAFFFLDSLLVFSQENKPKPGPVFQEMGAVFDVPNADFIPDSSLMLKAIFDIDRQQKDASQPNPLINSLHRYYNMHARAGVAPQNIQLAFVLHGGSTKDALSDEAYQERYGTSNPNRDLIKALAKRGVKMFICGQSAAYAGYQKNELMPEIQLALSAMSVLTVYQMDGYAMIKF